MQSICGNYNVNIIMEFVKGKTCLVFKANGVDKNVVDVSCFYIKV